MSIARKCISPPDGWKTWCFISFPLHVTWKKNWLKKFCHIKSMQICFYLPVETVSNKSRHPIGVCHCPWPPTIWLGKLNSLKKSQPELKQKHSQQKLPSSSVLVLHAIQFWKRQKNKTAAIAASSSSSKALTHFLSFFFDKFLLSSPRKGSWFLWNTLINWKQFRLELGKMDEQVIAELKS